MKFVPFLTLAALISTANASSIDAEHYGDQLVRCIMQKDVDRIGAQKALEKYHSICEQEVDAVRAASASESSLTGNKKESVSETGANKTRIPQPTDAALLKEAKAHVASKMKDPYSVRFQEVKACKFEDGEKFAFGLVNAKNSYGAYSGVTPFVYYRTLDKSQPFSKVAGDRSAGIAMIQTYATKCP